MAKKLGLPSWTCKCPRLLPGQILFCGRCGASQKLTKSL